MFTVIKHRRKSFRANNNFEFTAATTTANETFTIPCQNVGTFNATIDWGDGSTSTITAYNDADLTHTYATAGDHDISISGTFPNIYFNNSGDKLKVKSVNNLGNVGWAAMNNAFYGCSNMTSFTAGDCDTSSVTNMGYMFRSCSSLSSLDASSFSTSSVTSMSMMFRDCSSLSSLDVSSFSTGSVTSMNYMFYYCSSLTSLDVSSFNTSSVTSMGQMFLNCSSLTSLDVSSFNTSSVTNMSQMFSNCSSLTSLDVSSFSTSSVTNMTQMFKSCSSLTSLDLSSFNTSNVTNMYEMFRDSSSLTSLDLSSFNTSSVTSMYLMFYFCSSLTSLDVSSFNTSSVTNMNGMFYGCSSLTSLDVSSFSTSNVTNMFRMFQNCSSLTSLDVSSFSTSSVTAMNQMFYSCSSLTSLDLSSFNTSSVTTMNSMFRSCSSLSSLDLSSFNTSNVTDMKLMFVFCSSLTSIDVSSFDTSSVTDMSQMFQGVSSSTVTITGIENFDITSVATNNMLNFITSGSLSTSVYDRLLVNWEAQVGYNAQNPSFGSSKYTSSGAASTARSDLVTAGWSISDGGTAASNSIGSDVLLYVPFADTSGSTTADGYVLSSGTHTLTSNVFTRAGNAVINTDQTKMSGSSTSAYGPAGTSNDGWVLDSTISSGLEVGSFSPQTPLSIEFWFYCSNAGTGNYARLFSWGGFDVAGTGMDISSSNTDYDRFAFYEYTGSGFTRRGLGTYQLTANDWNHIYWAFQPSGSSYVGINGTISTTAGSYITNFAPVDDLHLLKTAANADDAAKGYIQEFIVRDSVPYTTNFTPSTTPLV